MTGVIYKITNKINEKCYIGQTRQNVNDRWLTHKRASTTNINEYNMCIKRAFRKYGIENFIFEIIEECDESLLNEREIYWISYYDSFRKGYNSTLGGGGRLGHLKLEEKVNDVIDLYLEGFSLRDLAREFNVDKGTIKSFLERKNIKLRETRTYRFSQEDRRKILEDINKGMSRKLVILKYKISHSYLSQLINGQRRI